ncbi:hypothetical protein [Coprobacter secundus]|uniref:hypothetical protein n=1 Tax=Coprobacter secundus TaxID=1501392 RepID=UPI0023F9C65F|nr:hypothetical protein [Coprobacter secundus]
MTTQELFKLFCKNNTNGAGRKERRYIETYGDVPFEEAFPVYLKDINSFSELKNKIENFERFLEKEGCPKTQSNVSESRYYYYKGVKYRFSSHVYPTGSMTNDILGVVDLAADPELINDIIF